MKKDLLCKLRDGEVLSGYEQIMLIVRLSMPAVMAQLSSIIMQYIDASMVGRLGASGAASIGLVTSCTWMFGGLCTAAVTGFTVQVAQKIGAGEFALARNIMKLGYIFAIGFSFILSAVGSVMSFYLPGILGADVSIAENATKYFLIYSLSLPFYQLNQVSSGMLQASGNMKVPGLLHILMCLLDVVFNFIFIFEPVTVWGITFPCMGLGVVGAALGTAAARIVVAVIMTLYLFFRSEFLGLRRGERFVPSVSFLKTGLRIALPVGFEEFVTGGAYVVSSAIVAPLGTIAIAANSFALTAESLCYMPGYGISAASTAIIGQSIGAGRRELTKKLGWVAVLFGMLIMTLSGILMYVFAPFMMSLLTTDAEVLALGVKVLRIEAFAEPLFAASIVALGVFRGAGDTFVPSLMNFISMWAVRLPMAAFLSTKVGLVGVWIAMCSELCFRGIIFIIRLSGKKWHRNKDELSN